MFRLKTHRQISLRNATMLAAWPGMGNVAIGAVDYFRRAVKMKPFGKIDFADFTIPDAIVVKDGVTSMPQMPKSYFYYSKDPALVVVEGEAQSAGEQAAALMSEVLDLAQKLHVRRIYTGAAFPKPMSYLEESTIYAVANEKTLCESLRKRNIKMLEQGQISGLNGLLLEFARMRDIEAVCLLSTLPAYAINFPNPRASAAIVRTISKLTGIDIDMHGLEGAVSEMDEKMSIIERKIHEVFPDMQKEGIPELEDDKIPGFVMEKIERLFKEAKLDRKKAVDLKSELDRWELYKLYEDRFLDLFKESH